MEMNLDNDQKGNKPLYISIYDQLYNQIMNGIFPPESKLPTEHELAKMFGVSRMTLRQALSLLQDDGLVKSIHGKGSYITQNQQPKKIIGLEKMGNPMYKCHTENIDEVEIDFRLDIESDYTKQVLKRKATAVVAIERWYRSNQNVVGYAFTFMAIETVADLNLDLQNKPQLLQMLEHGIYELANSATIDIKRSTAANPPSQKHKIVGGEECDLLLESVYINNAQAVVYNKYYIPKEFSSIHINVSK